MSGAFDQIKKKISLTRKSDPDFTDLDLSEIQIGKFTPEINTLLEKVKNLEVLYLTNCGLTTLEGFPNIKLVAVDLSKNQIDDDGNIEALLAFPELSQIIFNDNKIQKIESVLKLSALNKLIEIDFEGNPVASEANYSTTVFEKFPRIEYVDRKDKDGNEQPVDEEEFNDDEDDEDEEEYELEDNEDEEDEDFEEEEQSEEKPAKRGRKKK